MIYRALVALLLASTPVGAKEEKEKTKCECPPPRPEKKKPAPRPKDKTPWPGDDAYRLILPARPLSRGADPLNPVGHREGGTP